MKKTIYKKDSKNKIRQLTIFAINDTMIQESGLVGGKLTERVRKCSPKNIGKSNETTGEEQAKLEVAAKFVAKIKEGYFETIEEAENEEVILPMLAKEYHKEKHKVDWSTAYVQPKLDGMRCLDTPNGKISRKNTPIETMNHIKVRRFENLSCVVDGELYAHGLSFQDNMKLIKKKRKGSENVKFHVYDLISDKPFKDRYSLLKGISMVSDNVEIVPTYRVDTESDLFNHHKQFLEEGYEGTMLRWGNEGYKINGRSSNLLKLKDFIDLSCKVVDIVPSERIPEQGVCICELSDGRTFGTGMKFSHKEREEILTNKSEYIGKIAEVRFFEYTDEGIPRFPIVYGFRLDC